MVAMFSRMNEISDLPPEATLGHGVAVDNIKISPLVHGDGCPERPEAPRPRDTSAPDEVSELHVVIIHVSSLMFGFETSTFQYIANPEHCDRHREDCTMRFRVGHYFNGQVTEGYSLIHGSFH